VSATAQTDARRSQILLSSQWIMATGPMGVSLDALSDGRTCARLNATDSKASFNVRSVQSAIGVGVPVAYRCTL